MKITFFVTLYFVDNKSHLSNVLIAILNPERSEKKGKITLPTQNTRRPFDALCCSLAATRERHIM